MRIRDIDLINRLLSNLKMIEKKDIKIKRGFKNVNPVDEVTKESLVNLAVKLKKNDNIFLFCEDIKNLWVILLEKSVKCLRFHDNREPYRKHRKTPMAYGIDELANYFRKYSEFEGLLYGSSEHYRDHVIHVFRTWLLGLCIITNFYNKKDFLLEKMAIEGVIDKQIQPTNLEKISMWTIASLCHDLGYPLEKAHNILNTAKEMITFFVSNPKYHLDISFSGVQDYMHEYIVRLISSKMVKIGETSSHLLPGKKFTGRVQPKYYMKFSKSLENKSHGIVGAIILYKILVYFLESDYNINEDYGFSLQDVKQFYIRRDILRSIASHTTSDIYHMHTNTLSFLLYACDELQGWDRRAFSNFYGNYQADKQNNMKIETFSSDCVRSKEEIFDLKVDDIDKFIKNRFSQFLNYQRVFRDGQDTDKRSFNFSRSCDINIMNGKISINFEIPKDKGSCFEIKFDKNLDPIFRDSVTEMIVKHFKDRILKQKKYIFNIDPYHSNYSISNKNT